MQTNASLQSYYNTTKRKLISRSQLLRAPVLWVSSHGIVHAITCLPLFSLHAKLSCRSTQMSSSSAKLWKWTGLC